MSPVCFVTEVLSTLKTVSPSTNARGVTTLSRYSPAHQAPHRLALLGVLLLDQNSLYPTVDFLTAFALKPDFFTGLDEPAHRFQTQLLCFVQR
jgi:hypothetical protein